MNDILVTGAYGGMGRAAVEAHRAKGYRVFALDLKVASPEEGVVPVEADVTSEESVARAFGAVSEYTDSLCAIVHFAGLYMLDSLVEIDSAQFRRIFDVNLYGVFLVNRTFLPLLAKGGRIVITTHTRSVWSFSSLEYRFRCSGREPLTRECSAHRPMRSTAFARKPSFIPATPTALKA